MAKKKLYKVPTGGGGEALGDCKDGSCPAAREHCNTGDAAYTVAGKCDTGTGVYKPASD